MSVLFVRILNFKAKAEPLQTARVSDTTKPCRFTTLKDKQQRTGGPGHRLAYSTGRGFCDQQGRGSTNIQAVISLSGHQE